MKKIIVLIASSLIIMGCNTVQGIGKDVKKAGEVVENAAKR
ncbi:MAG TPA: entericidin A/B family lipoprotein [Noviherbaspirillum sp.]|nr:entericidin A/B family lipoprotein [Noviherbaspirillum sp.]HYD94632.1 entericidin A/B family lipoprotein [Noviherbaspirillum sp.]